MKTPTISPFISRIKASFNNCILVLHFGLAFGLIFGTGMLLHKNILHEQTILESKIQTAAAAYDLPSLDKVKKEATDKVCFISLFLDMINR